MTWIVEPAYAESLAGCDFESCFATDGALAKQIQNRSTIRFERGGRAFYVKRHEGVGWGEILKNLLRGCLPVTGAGVEWRALARLHELGIPTMRRAAYGDDGGGPARRRSLLVTEDLGPAESLERLSADWRVAPPAPRTRRVLIDRVARLARRLHDGGVNHRDFYLCHLLLGPAGERPLEEGPLYLIDLHRAQLRRRTPRRWIVKDLGGLYYSALHIGLSPRDLLRFARGYGALREAGALWAAVRARALEMDRRLSGS